MVIIGKSANPFSWRLSSSREQAQERSRQAEKPLDGLPILHHRRYLHALSSLRAQPTLTGQSDAAVCNAAQQAQRLSITQDMDFADTRKYLPGTHCGLIRLRLWEPGRLAQAAYFEGLLRQHDLNERAGCHVVATEHKLRVRRSE